jgi:hypothetical protein
MAGVYGAINSRADFFRVLGEATEIIRRMVASRSSDAAMLRIEKELAAMRQWSDFGSEPSEEQRKSIDVGLIAVRELENAEGVVADLANKLSELNNYFEDWPTDVQAANATDDDFFEDEK